MQELQPFQRFKSDWVLDSKAVLWTDVGYSFIISSWAKQVEELPCF